MNIKTRELSNGLIRQINQSDVPIEVKRLIVKDIMSQLENEADEAIGAELSLINEKSSEGEEENQ